MAARGGGCQRLVDAPLRAQLIVNDTSFHTSAQHQLEQRRPLYSQRQSPLVQPHGASAFIERTWDRFGIQDLAHEWVTVFQSMVGADASQRHQQGDSGRSHHASILDGMKLLIPDTVLLNPSGQPSLWFATASSGRVKTRQLVHATPREIMRAFTACRSPSPCSSEETEIVAIQRIGFQTRMLTAVELKAICREMESTRGVLQLPQLSPRASREPIHAASEGGDAAAAGDDHDELSGSKRSPGKPTESRSAARSFCLQQFVPRYGGVRFFAVWRQHHRRNKQPPAAAGDRKNAVSNLRTAGIRSAREALPQSPRTTRVHRTPWAAATSGKPFVCDLFAQRYPIAPPPGSRASSHDVIADATHLSEDEEPHQSRDGVDGDDAAASAGDRQLFVEDDGQRWMDQAERGEKLIPLRIQPKRRSRRWQNHGRDSVTERGEGFNESGSECDDDSDEEQHELVRVKRVLERLALDPNVVLPQLFHMKRVTVELLSRVNEVTGKHASPHHVVGLACEFFLDAKSRQAHIAGITGIQWEGCEPTWEALRFQDATAAKLSAFYASTASGNRGSDDEDGVDDSKTAALKRQQDALSLRLFDELNPRFPSVHSPLVDAAQWKFRSALLPPDAAPRFVGAEVPKKFRRGRFWPLLRPEQAVSVSRLHLSPRAPSPLASAVRHPLSRRFASDEAAPESPAKSPKKAPSYLRSDAVPATEA